MRTLRSCLSIYRIQLAQGLQYRFAAFAGAANSIFWVLIEITVYRVFFQYAKGGASATGLTLTQTVTYAWLGQFLFMIQIMAEKDIWNKITSGDVGVELCRPMDLYLHWFSKVAAGRTVPLFWKGSLILLAGLLMPSGWRITPPASLSGAIGCLLSACSAILLCSSYAMLVHSFRLNVSWGNGLAYMIMLLGNVLSGTYLPLQLWPDFLQAFLLYQPFAGYLDIPVRLYLGTMPPERTALAVGLQLLWTCVFIVAGRALLRRQLTKIVIQGG